MNKLLYKRIKNSLNKNECKYLIFINNSYISLNSRNKISSDEIDWKRFKFDHLYNISISLFSKLNLEPFMH